MEILINKYPYIVSDFSQLIKFSFNDALFYFKEKINCFESEYFFLINPNPSLLLPNKKFGIKNKIIDEIINIAFDLKINHSSSKVKIFTYKKYVKEIVEINEDDDTEMDKERICDLLLKEIDDSPKSDIITSLSSLYTKIDKSLKKEKIKKNKILKIILVNNQMAKYKNINEKLFSDEKLQNVLNEFINENSNFFGVELKYLDDRLLTQQRKGFESISDFLTGEQETQEVLNNEPKEEPLNIIKSIYLSNELLKKAEKISFNFNKKFKEIITNEELIKEIENMDELLLFYKDVMNSILYIKNKVNINYKNRDNYKQKINDYISIENLNFKKNEIISIDSYETLIENINTYKDNINEIKISNFVKKINDNKNNKRYNNCICWKNIVDYLLNQKQYIIQFLDIIQNSKTFIELFENEIIKKGREIINNNNEDEKDENGDDNDNY